jgi:hypothetical protein
MTLKSLTKLTTTHAINNVSDPVSTCFFSSLFLSQYFNSKSYAEITRKLEQGYLYFILFLTCSKYICQFSNLEWKIFLQFNLKESFVLEIELRKGEGQFYFLFLTNCLFIDITIKWDKMLRAMTKIQFEIFTTQTLSMMYIIASIAIIRQYLQKVTVSISFRSTANSNKSRLYLLPSH